MNYYQKAVAQLVEAGMEEKEAKKLTNWYQISGFLLPSNIISLVFSLIGIRINSMILLLIAIGCLFLFTAYVSKNANNVEMLKSRLKVLKPLCIVIFVLWLIMVLVNIFLLGLILK